MRIKLVDATSVIKRTGEPLQTDLLFAPIREILRDASVFATPYQQLYRTEGVEIDLRLVADSRPNAFADMDVNRCVNVNVGLLLSFCQIRGIPWKLNKLIMPSSRHSIDAVAEHILGRMMQQHIVDGIDKLLAAWHDSAQSNWEMLPVDDTLVQNQPWSFPSSFLYQEILVILITHELGHLHERLYLREVDHGMMERAESTLDIWVNWYKEFEDSRRTELGVGEDEYFEYEMFPVGGVPAREAQRLWADPLIKDNWKREIIADQFAFRLAQAIIAREYSVTAERGKSASGEVSIWTFPDAPLSLAELRMNLIIAFEIMFGMQRLFEFYFTSLGIPLPLQTHPPSLIRGRLFEFLSSVDHDKAGAEVGLASGYEAGFVVRLIFDGVIRQYWPQMAMGHAAFAKRLSRDELTAWRQFQNGVVSRFGVGLTRSW